MKNSVDHVPFVGVIGALASLTLAQADAAVALATGIASLLYVSARLYYLLRKIRKGGVPR